MKPVIETHALCKSYHGRPVVDHLNLTVPEGCVYGFLGPNGAGKSTTMKMLLGLVHPTGGSVELLGHTLNEANRIALLRQTGSLIESPSGYLHLTARENLSIVADLKDVDRKEISRVLDFIKKSATVQYDEAMIEAMEKHAIQDGKKGSGSADSDEEGGSDPMLKQAVEVVIDAGQASTSLLQRRCKLGYARAARIMDEMEEKGIIGPYEGAKPRAVLISRQQWLEMQMNQPDE